MPAPPPTPYSPSANFTAFEREQPATPKSGPDLDAQFYALQQSVSSLALALADVRSAGGGIPTGKVTYDTLSASVLGLMGMWAPRGLWATGQAYAPLDAVRYAPTGGTYVCAAAHTAGASFATDAAAGRWLVINNLDGGTLAAITAANGGDAGKLLRVTGANAYEWASIDGRTIGDYVFSAAPAPPDRHLWCYGQAVSRTTYAALFAVIGVTYGPGDGSTTFNIPDVRGRSMFGNDANGGSAALRLTAAASGVNGVVTGSVGGDQRVQAHSHSVTEAPHSHATTEAAHGHGTTETPHIHSTTHSVARNFYPDTTKGYVLNTSGSGSMDPNAVETTTAVSTGVGVNPATTNLTINSASTGLTVGTSFSGAGANIPPALVANVFIYAGA